MVLNVLGEVLSSVSWSLTIQSFPYLPYTVIHGYVQSAATVASNTRALKDKLSGIANLHYVDGPPMRNASYSSSRPWWILDSNLEHDMRASDRWDDTVCFIYCCVVVDHRVDWVYHLQVKWWSDELSKNTYDGIIGLSQGSAMTALLLSMVSTFSLLVYVNITLFRRITLTNIA